MTKWSVAGMTCGLGLVVVVGLAITAPVIHGQGVRVWSPGDEPQVRSLEILTGGGSTLGVTVRDVDQADLARAKAQAMTGVVVEEVDGEGAGARAGLKAGDLVTAFDGERVRSARQLARLVTETAPGRAVKATVLREGTRIELDVTPDRDGGLVPAGPRAFAWSSRGLDQDLGRAADEIRRGHERLGRDFAFKFDGPGSFGLDGVQGVRLGVEALEPSPELAARFGARQGVLVNAVRPGSPAAKAGIEVGDVITSVGGAAVGDTAELRRLLSRRDEADVTLGVVRDRQERSVKVSFDTQAPAKPRRRV
jgi:serine protease Do